MTFHPAFRPLHARLCGFDAGLDGVPAHTLLALYPVEMTSYEPFLSHFYAKPCADLADANAIYNTVQDVPIGTVEQAILKLTEPNWSVNSTKRTVTVPKSVEKFFDGLDGERTKVERNAINRQLTIAVAEVRILSMWDESAFASQKQPIQDNFMRSVKALTKFFGAKLPSTASIKS